LYEALISSNDESEDIDGDVVVTMHVISCFSSENYRSRYGI
jgi:hypothetical protein